MPLEVYRLMSTKYRNSIVRKAAALVMCSVMLICLAGCGGRDSSQTASSGQVTGDQYSDGQSSDGQPSGEQTQDAAGSEENSADGAGADAPETEDADRSEKGSGLTGDYVDIVLSESGAAVNGRAAGADSSAAVYIGNDIVYYEDRDSYDSGNPYGEGTAADRHTPAEAAANTVVYITEAGTYRLSGTLHGQVRVDLGEDASEDPEAVVTLVFDGADITCDVAPAVNFVNVYECGDSSTENASQNVDTGAAGANVIIADGSVNNIEGSHVARIYKDDDQQKKLVKEDGAFYSYMSMNIDGGEAGDGVLNITADNEGLNTELHLTINGGVINIFSQDDGINTNEDGVSVTTINGGEIHILSGLGSEGDGIDSNGWLVINGGTVVACVNPASDSGLDSDCGSYINGGTVVALGSTMDWADNDSKAVTINLQFSSYEYANESIVVTDPDGNNVFEFDPAADKVLADNSRRYMGAIISCPEFTVGESYYIYVGGKQQSYTGTDVSMGPGGMGPRGQGGFGPGGQEESDPGSMGPGRDDGEWPSIPDGEMPSWPEGEFPTMPDGEAPQMPDGTRPEWDGGEMPTMPDGQMPGGMGQPDAAGEQNIIFIMGDTVNSFSGVSDYTE